LSLPTCGLVSKSNNSSETDYEKEGIRFKMIGGRNASNSNKHPWHAVIVIEKFENQHMICGGTLIQANVVLTGNYATV